MTEQQIRDAATKRGTEQQRSDPPRQTAGADPRGVQTRGDSRG